MRKRQTIRKTKNAILVDVEILLIKEGKYFVAYCPALGVSSYGDSEKEAKTGFEEALNIFIDETERKGSFEKALLKMGWSLKQLPVPSYIPPRKKISTLSKFRYNKSTERFKESVALPL